MKKKKAMSLLVLTIILSVVFVAIVASMSVAVKLHNDIATNGNASDGAVNINESHGAYLCYVDAGDRLKHVRVESLMNGQEKAPDIGDGCDFVKPNGAKAFKFTLIGGGGGGASVYNVLRRVNDVSCNLSNLVSDTTPSREKTLFDLQEIWKQYCIAYEVVKAKRANGGTLDRNQKKDAIDNAENTCSSLDSIKKSINESNDALISLQNKFNEFSLIFRGVDFSVHKNAIKNLNMSKTIDSVTCSLANACSKSKSDNELCEDWFDCSDDNFTVSDADNIYMRIADRGSMCKVRLGQFIAEPNDKTNNIVKVGGGSASIDQTFYTPVTVTGAKKESYIVVQPIAPVAYKQDDGGSPLCLIGEELKANNSCPIESNGDTSSSCFSVTEPDSNFDNYVVDSANKKFGILKDNSVVTSPQTLYYNSTDYKAWYSMGGGEGKVTTVTFRAEDLFKDNAENFLIDSGNSHFLSSDQCGVGGQDLSNMPSNATPDEIIRNAAGHNGCTTEITVNGKRYMAAGGKAGVLKQTCPFCEQYKDEHGVKLYPNGGVIKNDTLKKLYTLAQNATNSSSGAAASTGNVPKTFPGQGGNGAAKNLNTPMPEVEFDWNSPNSTNWENACNVNGEQTYCDGGENGQKGAILIEW